MAARTDWAVPQVEHPAVDMLERQSAAVREGGQTLPYPGLPRDWTRRAVEAVLLFDPDKVFLYGSALHGTDTLRSDIDLLIAFDEMPVEVWFDWECEIRRVGRFYCPYPVAPVVTDVEDLTRMRRLVVSPCMWAQEDGELVYDKQAGERP